MKNNQLFDTHCHLNMEPYTEALDTYINYLNETKTSVNIVGTTYEDSQLACALAQQFNMYATIGIHPNEVEKYDVSVINQLEKVFFKYRDVVVALGETGLDYHYEGYDKLKQQDFFRKHINLAIKNKLTLVLHIRDAHEDAINILKEYRGLLPNTIIHCFTGTMKDALEYIALGCYISFSGIVTFKNAGEIRDVVNIVPQDRMLSETDAPFLTPVPHRGEVNMPQYVDYVNLELAKIRNLSKEAMDKILMDNAKACFKIK